MKEQTCNNCQKLKPLESFEWQKNRPNPRKTCKLCRSRQPLKPEVKARKAEAKKVKYQSDKVGYRQGWERSVYGVCKEDFDYSYCAICQSETKLCIDHDHGTGAVRGLLCLNCNLALGNFHDSIEKLEKAIMYLKKPPFVDKPHFQIEK